MSIINIALAVLAVHVAPPVQDAAPAAPASAAQASEWHAFSRSASTAYLIDLGSIVTSGDTATLRVAKVPRDRNAQVDVAWRLEDVAVRCRAEEVKSLLTMEFAPDGNEMGRYEGDDVWDPIGDSGYLQALKEVACDGARAEGRSFPTLAAFMDSPR